MPKIDDGDPAFPMPEEGSTPARYPGMSLRDWFAGQALTGYLSGSYPDPEHAAKQCYEYADAMLAARQK